MVLTFEVLFTAALLLSGVTIAVLAAFAYRHREVPGALAFAAMLAAMAYWAFVYAIGLQITNDEQLRIAVLQIQWLAHPTIPLFLFLFALAYTGNDEFLTRRRFLGLAAIPAIVVLAAWTNPWHHLLWTDQAVHVVDGMAVLVPTYGPLFWINIVYGYGIEFVAIAVLVRLIFTSDYLYKDQSALLFVGIVVPFVTNIVEIFVIGSTPAVDPTAVSYAVSSVAWGYAVFRRQLLELIPATRKLGRNAAIGQLDTGIVIVDDDDRVVYANRSAADIFDTEPLEMLGQPVRSFVDDEWLDFDAEDALAEVVREDRTFEIRSSAISDRQGREIGHTLVFHDVTARERRERELATVNDLNAVIRGVNQALVSARSRAGIERAVADRLAESDLFDGVCVADVQTWTGAADRWRLAGEVFEAGPDGDGRGPSEPPEIDADRIRVGEGDERDDATDLATVPAVDDGQEAPGNWLVVPLVYGRTVYGAIGLVTERESVSEQERDVLAELGETVGHAINAVESRELVATEGVVELEVAVEDADDPLAAVTDAVGARIDVLGIVPRSGEGHLAYLEVVRGPLETVRDRLAAAGIGVRTVGADEDGGTLEVAVDDAVSLGPIVASDAHVLGGTIADGRATYEVLVPSTESARTLIDRLETAFPSTELRSKREHERPFASADGLSADRLSALTDRQREALAAAVRAGYFEWPRDADAESVAASMDIASPTLHRHLRKAQRTLLEDLFEASEEG